jgi:HSP20 family molecular chaperone IbpA
VKKNEILLDIDPDKLIVHGHQKQHKEFESAASRVKERHIGKYFLFLLFTLYRFRKVVRIPIGCKTNEISTHYEDGLLEIKVPKGFEKKVIEIK